jgi:DNA-binding MarR family transcriptional regulator
MSSRIRPVGSHARDATVNGSEMRRVHTDGPVYGASGAPAADADLLAVRAMDGLRRIVHALRLGTNAAEQSVRLSSAQVFVLRQLHTQSGQSLGDLARRTRTTQGSVSEVVGRLIGKGLIAREASANDRRRAVLTLTAAGAELIEAGAETVQDRLVTGFSRLDHFSQQTLVQSLEAWLEASELADVSPVLFFEP